MLQSREGEVEVKVFACSRWRMQAARNTKGWTRYGLQMWKVDLYIFSFICQVLSFCFAFRNFQNLDNFLNCRLKVRLVQRFI